MTKNIKSERVRIGLSQDVLADKLGVHVNSVRKWENGETQPGSLSLIAMSKIFNCSTKSYPRVFEPGVFFVYVRISRWLSVLPLPPFSARTLKLPMVFSRLTRLNVTIS